MKTLTFLALLLSASPMALADMKSDHDAITAMKGCYEVSFHFEETGTTDPNYPIKSKEYNESALEWIELDRDTGDLVSLQHMLIIPDEGVQKHWRQQWEFQPTSALYFKGNATWKTEELNANDVNGKWIQRVFQVDDSPRYECVASFQKDSAGQDFWECATWAPLPRREFTQRSDYNVVGRGNKHLITKDGWLHIQNNGKLVVDMTTGQSKQIATEKGLDTYKRVDDSRCTDAVTYWKSHKQSWNAIQDMWMHMRGHHPSFSLKSKVDGNYLWEALFELEEQATSAGTADLEVLQQNAHDLIHQYMVVLP